MDDLKKTVASNIKKLRTAKGWTLEYMAEQVGISHQSISKFEKSKAFPSIDSYLKISKAFNIHPSQLMYGSEIANCASLDETINSFIALLKTQDKKTIQGLYNVVFAMLQNFKI